MAKRKLNLTSSAKQPKPAKLVSKKSPADTKKAASAKKSTRKATPRFSHGITTDYAGPSQPVNKSRSRTRVPVETFGSNPDLVLRERSEQLLAPVKAKYGKKPFKLGDLDRGVVRMAGVKGVLEYVDGDPATEDAQFRFIS